MMCPRCGYSLAQETPGRCPKCGTAYSRQLAMVMKTSSVLIAAGGECQFYRSVSEVPAGLRKTLQESTNSANSQTILIADRRGKEEIARALDRISDVTPAKAPASAAEPKYWLSWRNWTGIGIVIAGCVAAWLICARRW